MGKVRLTDVGCFQSYRSEKELVAHETGKQHMLPSIRSVCYQVRDGVPQLQREGFRHLAAFEVAAQRYRLFQCLQADLTRFARADVRFNLLAGGGVQFPVDIFGKLLEQRQAVFMGKVRMIRFHSRFSVLL